ncbi:hypothetical protein M0805_008324 [Coniferiporia weirii]|nr:hypothetical protein M0805_008324 [Coniferiporia weirii]
MDFPSKSGCPMCGIVSRALHSAPNSPLFSPQGSPTIQRIQRRSSMRAGSAIDDTPEVLWRDDNFTVYRERAHPVSSNGHIIIAFNLHVPSLYMLSTSDVPLLISLRSLAHRFLSQIAGPPASPSATPVSSSSLASRRFTSPTSTSSPPLASASAPLSRDPSQSQFRVGFITPPWKDGQIPVKDHLHAHAYVAPADLCSWWRSVAYGPLAWYAVEDLIAEIREDSTNNRVKSGYANRSSAPIDRIPSAGARSGTANGLETTETGLTADIEAGGRTHLSNLTPSPAPPARLAAPSHLDLNAAVVLSPIRSSTPTPTRSTFPNSAASPGLETQPGSSLSSGGHLLSPAAS